MEGYDWTFNRGRRLPFDEVPAQHRLRLFGVDCRLNTINHHSAHPTDFSQQSAFAFTHPYPHSHL